MAMAESCMPAFHYVSTLSVGHVLAAAAAAGTGQGMPGGSGSRSREGRDPPAQDDNVVFSPVSAAAYEPEQVPVVPGGRVQGALNVVPAETVAQGVTS